MECSKTWGRITINKASKLILKQEKKQRIIQEAEASANAKVNLTQQQHVVMQRKVKNNTILDFPQ